MWLNQPFKITREAISIVTGLNSSSGFPKLKVVKNQTITEATSSIFNKRAMTINDIIELGVRFSSMVIRYKTYHSNWDNFVSGTLIYVAYQMINENAENDLCELLQSQLIENIGKIKNNKKNSFKYGNLLLCLFFYFMNEFARVGKVQWEGDRPVAIQIKDILYRIGDRKERKTAIWGYFKSFQSEMQARERIPKSIVEKHKDTICFMVNTY